MFGVSFFVCFCWFLLGFILFPTVVFQCSLHFWCFSSLFFFSCWLGFCCVCCLLSDYDIGKRFFPAVLVVLFLKIVECQFGSASFDLEPWSPQKQGVKQRDVSFWSIMGKMRLHLANGTQGCAKLAQQVATEKLSKGRSVVRNAQQDGGFGEIWLLKNQGLHAKTTG